MNNAPQPFDNVVRASLRALQGVVAPALDRDNPLAQEQLALVCRFLGFVAQRAPLAMARQWLELHLAHAMAQELLQAIPGAPQTVREHALAACDRARTLLDASVPDTDRLVAETASLNASISAWVRSSRAFDPSPRAQLEAIVLRHSQRVTQLHRAWFSPLGLDPEAAGVPSLESLLAARAQA
ncbi:MAG: hypothetical protein V4609_13025 [Pseudomonadota bacterium]